MRDAALIFAFIEVESGFRAVAFANDRSGGSYGLTQIELASAADRGFTGNALGLYDPATNIEYWCRITDWITAELTKHGVFSLEALAAAYNSGLQHVLDGGTDAAYSGKIATAYAKWQRALGDIT